MPIDPRIEACVRKITDEEVAFYLEHGWVKLERLVDRDLASQMLKLVVPRVGSDDSFVHFDVRPTKEGAEPFRAIVFSETMGRNAQRLIDRRRLNDADVPVRLRHEVIVSKQPGAKGTPHHQDCYAHSPDRGGEMMFWLALDEVTPEMGSMRFLSGSHREGPLGTIEEEGKDLLDLYPKLSELYQDSSQVHYQPGDATVHNSYMIHSAPQNASDRVRLGYIFMYSPADVRYFRGDENGEISKTTGTRNGGERVTLDDPWFWNSPIIYPVPYAGHSESDP